MTPDLSTAPNAILRGSHQIDAEQWLQTFADEGASDKMRPELNIVDHLAAHGVTAQTVNLAKAGGGVGTVIVQYCRDNDPDL